MMAGYVRPGDKVQGKMNFCEHGEIVQYECTACGKACCKAACGVVKPHGSAVCRSCWQKLRPPADLARPPTSVDVDSPRQWADELGARVVAELVARGVETTTVHWERPGWFVEALPGNLNRDKVVLFEEAEPGLCIIQDHEISIPVDGTRGQIGRPSCNELSHCC